MKIQPRDKRALLRAALGEIKSDLAIKNVQLVQQFMFIFITFCDVSRYPLSVSSRIILSVERLCFSRIV